MLARFKALPVEEILPPMADCADCPVSTYTSMTDADAKYSSITDADAKYSSRSEADIKEIESPPEKNFKWDLSFGNSLTCCSAANKASPCAIVSTLGPQKPTLILTGDSSMQEGALARNAEVSADHTAHRVAADVPQLG